MEVKNTTKQIIHLPHGRITLEPGVNEVDKNRLERNEGHPGYESQLQSGDIKLLSVSEEEKESDIKVTESEYPKKTSKHSSWYKLSTGETVQGEETAIELQKKIDEGELDG